MFINVNALKAVVNYFGNKIGELDKNKVVQQNGNSYFVCNSTATIFKIHLECTADTVFTRHLSGF